MFNKIHKVLLQEAALLLKSQPNWGEYARYGKYTYSDLVVGVECAIKGLTVADYHIKRIFESADYLIDKMNTPYKLDILNNSILDGQRVYILEDLLDVNEFKDIVNEKFMDLAEEQGSVYSMAGFQEAINTAKLSLKHKTIRIL